VEKNSRRVFVRKIEELPTVSSALSRIIAVVDNENSSAAELTEVVSKDPAISSMILRLVNSAFYGHLREISTISRAVVILGFQTVKTMAMGVSLFHEPRAGVSGVFDRDRLWLHSIGAGAVAKRLYVRSTITDIPDEETAFLIGLLHDIGKIVFDNYFSEDNQRVITCAMEQKRTVSDVEKEIFGITHGEAGALLAHRWKFPALVEEAIGYHHQIASSTHQHSPAVALAHLSDHCCHVLGFDYWDGDMRELYDPETLVACGLTQKDIAIVLDEIEEERSSIEGLLGE